MPVVTHVEPTSAVIAPSVKAPIQPEADTSGHPSLTNIRAEAPVAGRTAPALPDLPAAEPDPFGATQLSQSAAPVETPTPEATAPEADATAGVFGLPCGAPVLSLEPAARGMLRVALSAPCFPDQRMTVSHSGIAFSAMTDHGGEYETMLSALAPEAEVTVEFSGAEPLTARQRVTGLDSLIRVAVQAKADAGIEFHIFEDGAGYGDAGHVSPQAPRDRMAERGGFLNILGDPTVEGPILTQIYSAPLNTQIDTLQVEVAVSPANCDRILSAETLIAMPGSAPVSEVLTIAMPDCAAVGDIVVMDLSALTADRIVSAQAMN
jgi:hypothetical protein